MIPQKIHYCWFGRGEKPKLAQKCISSWRKYCPDYEIVEWNEDNFDIDLNEYTKMCYREKRYAFLSDYARLLIVKECGGVYFDTDVEILKSFNTLLEYQAFFGFETKRYVNTGLGFGSEAGASVFDEMIKMYDPLLPGDRGITGCPILNTQALVNLGMHPDGKAQIIGKVAIFPSDYFNPYDDPTGILTKTENTYSIHWYGKSWMSKKSIIRSTLTKPLHRLQKRFGKELGK